MVDDYTSKDIVLSDAMLSPNANDDSRRRSFARNSKDLIVDGLVSTDGNDLVRLPQVTE